ncbi:MAG: hypothetical protein MK207_01205 [Saprospiraceae bacterium]|nr:hypothetical protein [Saprospiraceae bacterium]
MDSLLTRFFIFFVSIFFLFQGCEKNTPPINNLTPQDDSFIGNTLDHKILEYINCNSNIQYLDRITYQSSYAYVDNIITKIESSMNFVGLSAMANTSICSTTIRIIHQADNTSAFVVPGGFIYLYKDFLKKIKTEAQFVAVVSHLMACSKKRLTIPKLEDRFSKGFLIDLALGSDLNVDLVTVFEELGQVHYDSLLVEELDIEAEHTTCELGYDIKSYSDLFNCISSQNLDWYSLFPRRMTPLEYATHLFNEVKNDSICFVAEEDGEPAYLNFKNSLN